MYISTCVCLCIHECMDVLLNHIMWPWLISITDFEPAPPPSLTSLSAHSGHVKRPDLWWQEDKPGIMAVSSFLKRLCISIVSLHARSEEA